MLTVRVFVTRLVREYAVTRIEAMTESGAEAQVQALCDDPDSEEAKAFFGGLDWERGDVDEVDLLEAEEE